jgi:hypothetical protein
MGYILWPNRGRGHRGVNWQSALLFTVSFGVIVAVAMVDPVPQDPLYHLFADQRTMASVPNFLNVISNLPFLLVGIMGWRMITQNEETVTPATRRAWIIFFFGVALTAFGSGYFHLQPDNDTLIWDRLPMTIAFMSLFSIIVAEYLSPQLGRQLLMPLLIIGVACVAYWAYTESLGAGDLRPYAVVQFLPMLLIPLIILLHRTRSDLGPYLWWTIGFYVAAKVAEQLDDDLFALGGALSGHSLKHMLASLAPASLLYGLMRRRGRCNGFSR